MRHCLEIQTPSCEFWTTTSDTLYHLLGISNSAIQMDQSKLVNMTNYLTFKAQWIFHLPHYIALKQSAFYPHSVLMYLIWLAN